ncbi:MAG TPA: DMT family transporter [Gemmatimonadaceae bacterium]|nr:DMT family transporter [Gemmatimonadaceae bacterium]
MSQLEARRRKPVAASPVLVLALVGVSFAGPLIRLSRAHPLAIATWRLGLSLLVIAAFLLVRGEWRQWRRLSARELALAGGAGALLALHFWSWNASIGLTTVAASVVLVNTQPVIVAVLSALWLREPPSRRQWAGIAVAMVGAALVAAPDLLVEGAPARRAALGNLLALVGAVTAAIYFVSGRRLRGTLDLWPYVGLVYGACFVVLLGLSFASGVRLAGPPPRELAIFAALALGPMLLGHTGLNWALRYLPAYVVNLTLLGEPVGATIIAALLPGIREVPPAATVGGGVLILVGVLAASWRRERR